MAKEKERIIRGVYLKTPIHDFTEFVLGTDVDLAETLPPEITTRVVNITRIKDRGVDMAADVHSENWPGFVITIIESAPNQAVPDKPFQVITRLYVPENNICAVWYEDRDVQKDNNEVVVSTGE